MPQHSLNLKPSLHAMRCASSQAVHTAHHNFLPSHSGFHPRDIDIDSPSPTLLTHPLSPGTREECLGRRLQKGDRVWVVWLQPRNMSTTERVVKPTVHAARQAPVVGRSAAAQPQVSRKPFISTDPVMQHSTHVTSAFLTRACCVHQGCSTPSDLPNAHERRVA